MKINKKILITIIVLLLIIVIFFVYKQISKEEVKEEKKIAEIEVPFDPFDIEKPNPIKVKNTLTIVDAEGRKLEVPVYERK